MTDFIGQALIFMGASVVLVPLFQRLGFGSVVGYLIAGVLIGPVAGLIENAHSVSHFSELGVVLLLFVIGLEIQPPRLWSMRRQLIGLGGLQVLACSIAFTLLSRLFGLEWMPSLIIGFSLSLSSTAFALQNLIETNQLKTDFGRSSFAVLLTQDLVAIPALAIIPALVSSGGNEATASSKIFAFVGVVVVLVLLSRFLIRPLFRLIARNRSREIFTAATLLIVLGVSAVMLKIGLSAALGTFIAGVLLADSEFRHELEANLDPFKSILMGLFFIGVGLLVSLETILARPLLIAGVTLLYIVVKLSLIYAVGRLNKLSHETAKLMAITIGQGGEFAFVLFGLVTSMGIIEPAVIEVLTAVITLSMILSPVIGRINETISAKFITTPDPVYDVIKDENPEVIIAGFGRFGQVFGRILRSQRIPFVAIDHDADQIELLRKFGNKVYYGEASRLEILEAAGVARAKYFILSIDDVDLSVATAKILRENYPDLKVFARARNRSHAYDLIDLGVEHIKRETLDSSANFVGELLLEMGWEPGVAQETVAKFRRHDEILLREQHKVRNDDKSLISVSHQGQAQLEEVLKQESQQSFIN
jgi:monovalent cation:proton antiporter-2 (CPA2) family protein